MALYTDYFLPSNDGKTKIHVNQWEPEYGKIKGVVQIAHGVAEYGQRYDNFARFLTEQGYVVVANDHLGHGKSLIEDSPMVYFGEKRGWWNVVEDMETVRLDTIKKFPFKPYFLFGHSMGSFLSRTYLIKYPGKINGCILCGTGQQPGIMLLGGRIVTAIEAKRLGMKGYSDLTEKLVFGSYNKSFEPKRTEFDWLSQNEANVDAYIEDPLCGGKATIGLFKDMMEGLSFITKDQNLQRMEKGTSILFISGKMDPVGDMGKGVKKAYQSFKKVGMEDVKAKLYKGLRHEILNESDYQRVYDDVLKWLDKHCL